MIRVRNLCSSAKPIKTDKSNRAKIVVPQEEPSEYKLIHYKDDESLTKCAIELMDLLDARTEKNLYTTNKQIERFLVNYGEGAKTTAKRMLEGANYATFDLIRRNTKGWRAIRTHRTFSEIAEATNRSCYANLPTISENGGFVYVFKRLRDGIYKIGVANNLRSRASGIACSCGSHLEFYTAIDIANYLEIESELHDCFDHKRTVGEWFELDPKDLTKIYNFFVDLESGGF